MFNVCEITASGLSNLPILSILSNIPSFFTLSSLDFDIDFDIDFALYTIKLLKGYRNEVEKLITRRHGDTESFLGDSTW